MPDYNLGNGYRPMDNVTGLRLRSSPPVCRAGKHHLILEGLFGSTSTILQQRGLDKAFTASVVSAAVWDSQKIPHCDLGIRISGDWLLDRLHDIGLLRLSADGQELEQGSARRMRRFDQLFPMERDLQPSY